MLGGLSQPIEDRLSTQLCDSQLENGSSRLKRGVNVMFVLTISLINGWVQEFWLKKRIAFHPRRRRVILESNNQI